MGVIKQGILGGFQNKVGAVIGSNWKGIATMRSRPISVANPRTGKQVSVRSEFSTLVKISSFTSYEHLIFNETIWAYSSFVIFLVLAAIITPHLHREILALRLPLKEWLRLHHLR